MSDLVSHIFVCPDIEKAYQHIQKKYTQNRICPFIKEKDEFLLEDAKAVVKEAYIAELKPKILVLGAKGYRVEAQNSLLKILEEPPRNVIFILICFYFIYEWLIIINFVFRKNIKINWMEQISGSCNCLAVFCVSILA